MSLLQGLGNQAPEPPGGRNWAAVDHPPANPQRPQIPVDRLSAWSQGAEECAHTIQELGADSLPAGAAADVPRAGYHNLGQSRYSKWGKQVIIFLICPTYIYLILNSSVFTRL